MMLKCCEEYALEQYLEFSTDPDPNKPKSKCIYFKGKVRNRELPDHLVLLGEKLPWVEKVEHLGHLLHQSCSLEHDAAVKRARFIDKTVELREVFSFALPSQVIRAVQIYASDCYGVMLYDLASQSSESYFKAWNTCVKLIWDVPRSTYTYIVENTLAAGFDSLRNQVYARYVTYFQKLFQSSSKEVRHLVRIVARDARSVTWKNVSLIKEVSGLSPWDYSKWRIKEKLPRATVPANNEWRLGLLQKLLEMRRQQEFTVEDTDRATQMIDSLCTT